MERKTSKMELFRGFLKSKVFLILVVWFFSMIFVYWFRSNYHFVPLIKTFKLEFQNIIQPNIISPLPKVKAKALVGEVLAMSVTPTVKPTEVPIKKGITPVKKYLTEQGAKNREWVLAYVAKYYKGDEIVAFDNIMKNEAGYRADAMNEGGCGGMPQACPASKMNCPLDDSGLECQTQFAIGYINRRYGSPIKAWEFWQARVKIDGKDVGNWY